MTLSKRKRTVKGSPTVRRRRMRARTILAKHVIDGLPDGPGVYLFFGGLGELLYVGKSKSIRTRVRSHFSATEERWMVRKVKRVETHETAGELGALLLESRLIKEMKPMFNVAARQRRRIIVARQIVGPQGYSLVNLEPIDYLSLRPEEPILGVFKHKTQAKEFLSTIAKTHRLCPKLLRLEQTRGYCFSYHLGQCAGACMGEEDPADYNSRLNAAFDARRIKAWPYDGGIVIEKCSKDRARREMFLIDNWCLVASFKTPDDDSPQQSTQQHRFDYDSYKILYSFMSDPQNQDTVSVVKRATFDLLCKTGFNRGDS